LTKRPVFFNPIISLPAAMEQKEPEGIFFDRELDIIAILPVEICRQNGVKSPVKRRKFLQKRWIRRKPLKLRMLRWFMAGECTGLSDIFTKSTF
jgi:hypothetical protein